MMILKLLIWICGFLLILGVSLSAAQETGYSLRGLAERSNFYVGAAAWTYHLDDPIHAETLSREFNMLTPEHEAKHCMVERQRGQYDFTNVDRLVAFAEEHDMVIHGHTLVWHSCMPRWLETGPFERDEAIQLLRDYIMTMVGRYKGRIAIWDVVNEAMADGGGGGLRDTPWRQWIGDDYIEMAFQFAHEADPDALLFYNDYGAEGMNAKSDAVYEMVSDLVARGIPIHGVGLQSHFSLGGLNPTAIAENMQRLGELGLQVQITEMDVRFTGEPSDDILERQGGDYHKLLDTCLSSEYCTAFVVWGVSDRYTWLRGANLGFFENPAVEPLLFDDDYKPKPAYFAMMDVLARKAGVASLLTNDQVNAMLGARSSTDEILAPTKSDPAQLAPDSVAGKVYYAAFPVAITLDGETDDWANVPRVTVDSGPMLPNRDTALTFAVAADDTHLYFLAEVKDSKLAYGTHNPASEWYLEDSVEFYLNTTGDLKLAAYQPGVAQIGIMAANITKPDAPIIGGGNSSNSQVKVVAVETEEGYRVEAAVPLVTKVWTIKPEHLGVLGFQAHLNGASTPDGRDTKLIWSAYDTQDQSWTNPSLFGQLVFWDVKR